MINGAGNMSMDQWQMPQRCRSHGLRRHCWTDIGGTHDGVPEWCRSGATERCC